MYIQDTYRKLYSNRFMKGLIDLIDEHKKPNESRTKFIEDAIIEKLRKEGARFTKPLTEAEEEAWDQEVSEW